MASSSVVVPKSKIKELLSSKGVCGNIIAGAFMSLLGINRINRICKPAEGLYGVEFAEKALECAGVTVIASEKDLSQIPEEGPFILCANHPFGSIDGLILLSKVYKIRPDLKVLANYILSNIPVLSEIFLPVNPFAEGRKSSHKGIRMALEQLRKGGALAIFPAGEVSSNCNKENVVKDKEWQRGIMRLISGANVPVVPAYFHGQNSKLFHAAGKIHPRLRTILLPHEFTNKRGTEVIFKVGRPISPSEIKSYSDPSVLATYLWNRSYALEAEIDSPAETCIIGSTPEIESHTSFETIKRELDSLESDVLYAENGYVCYLSRYENIPNIIREIGIYREETFRKVGEGTNMSIDLDDYDKYYYHMHLWNLEDNSFVGAYRIGLGNEIIAEYGSAGFYSDQFFHYDKELVPILECSMELGRSFIVPSAQVRPLSLNMLMKGLLNVIRKYPHLNYFFGPASITSDMPRMYQSLIIKYLSLTRGNREYSSFVHPVHPFIPEYLRIESDKIVKATDSIEQFDRTISRLSGGQYRIPTLVRKYFKYNCTFLCFNVDPDFNYSLDCLLLVDISKLPAEDLDFLGKEK